MTNQFSGRQTWRFAGPSGRAVYGLDLLPFACWDCGFESHREHGCLSVICVLCCQVEVSAASWSLVPRSPTDWCVVVCDLETPWKWRFWPSGGCRAKGKQKTWHFTRSVRKPFHADRISFFFFLIFDQQSEYIVFHKLMSWQEPSLWTTR